MKRAIFVILTFCFSLGASAQDSTAEKGALAEEQEIYIPKDLDDAVRELKKSTCDCEGNQKV